MYNFTREDIDLETIRARIARMSDSALLKYGQSAAWMAEHNDRATWRVQLERKALLRKLLPLRQRAVRYVEHVASGTALFRAICELDMEGIVAKQAGGLYTPEATTWVKI
jgi:hypothetical protein